MKKNKIISIGKIYNPKEEEEKQKMQIVLGDNFFKAFEQLMDLPIIDELFSVKLAELKHNKTDDIELFICVAPKIKPEIEKN